MNDFLVYTKTFDRQEIKGNNVELLEDRMQISSRKESKTKPSRFFIYKSDFES